MAFDDVDLEATFSPPTSYGAQLQDVVLEKEAALDIAKDSLAFAGGTTHRIPGSSEGKTAAAFFDEWQGLDLNRGCKSSI
jgi:hypothetical protein